MLAYRPVLVKTFGIIVVFILTKHILIRHLNIIIYCILISYNKNNRRMNKFVKLGSLIGETFINVLSFYHEKT
jgi:hypothetical protein